MSRTFTVLGASGFVGSQLATKLCAEQAECFVPARNDPEIFRRPLGHAIYCIGYTADFRQHPLEAAEAHVSVLLDILRRATFESLLYLSSTRVYDGASDTHESTDLRVNPNDPNHVFNLTKLAGEACCLSQTRAEIRIARLSNVVGEDFGSSNFVNSILRDAIVSKRVRLRSTADSAKDYISIQDVVQLLPEISQFGRERIYNVASGVNVSNETLLRCVSSLAEAEIEYEPAAQRVVFPSIEISRLRRDFAFTPRDALSTLRDMFPAYRKRLLD